MHWYGCCRGGTLHRRMTCCKRRNVKVDHPWRRGTSSPILQRFLAHIGHFPRCGRGCIIIQLLRCNSFSTTGQTIVTILHGAFRSPGQVACYFRPRFPELRSEGCKIHAKMDHRQRGETTQGVVSLNGHRNIGFERNRHVGLSGQKYTFASDFTPSKMRCFKILLTK